jgi:hypothetical protein
MNKFTFDESFLSLYPLMSKGGCGSSLAWNIQVDPILHYSFSFSTGYKKLLWAVAHHFV